MNGARPRLVRRARSRRLALAAVTLLVAPAACTTPEQAPVGMVVARPYYVLPAGRSPAAIYLTITNRTAVADTLTAIECDAGLMVVLHGAMPKMETLTDLAIAPGETLRLAPGARHGMVAAPRPTIMAGDSVLVTLRFARAGAVLVRAAAIGYADVDTATALRE